MYVCIWSVYANTLRFWSLSARICRVASQCTSCGAQRETTNWRTFFESHLDLVSKHWEKPMVFTSRRLLWMFIPNNRCIYIIYIYIYCQLQVLTHSCLTCGVPMLQNTSDRSLGPVLKFLWSHQELKDSPLRVNSTTIHQNPPKYLDKYTSAVKLSRVCFALHHAASLLRMLRPRSTNT
jgi:hypothetical protein